MFDAASRREFDAILFWSLDRFTREGTLPTLQYLQQLDAYNVAFPLIHPELAGLARAV
jgi:DNA invertase Pin-like site-specific DNA recombinase